MNTFVCGRRRLLTATLVVAGVLATAVPGGVDAAPSPSWTPGAPSQAPAMVGAAPAAKSCAKTYTAVANDSWWRIASKVKVTLKELLSANNARSSTSILIGDVLCLPKSAVTKEQARGLSLKPPEKRHTKAASEKVIREIFPDHLENRAVAIAKRESKLNAASWNWCCIGLFQINWWSHRSWLKAEGITEPEQLLNARTNAEVAWMVYKRAGGWGPWE
ncbi:MAG: LysM peptidoglycan-binding domain-containing protein [Actinomycetota bacterium]